MRMWWNRIAYNAEGGDGGSASGASADPAATGAGASTGNPAGGGEGGAAGASGTASAADKGWFETLDPAIRADPSIGKFAGQDVTELAKAYVSASKFIGSDPGDLVKVSEVSKDPAALLRRLGAPEKPDGYALKAPDGAPEHLAAGENLDWFKAQAAEIGLLPGQAEKLYQSFVTRSVEIEKAANAASEKAVDALRLEFGQAFDQEVGYARAAATTLGIKDELNAAGLGASPAVVKALAKVGRMLGEGASPGGSDPAGGYLPPATAAAKAKALTREALTLHRAGNKEAAQAKRDEAARYYKMATG